MVNSSLRKGYQFLTHVSCWNTVFNSLPTYVGNSYLNTMSVTYDMMVVLPRRGDIPDGALAPLRDLFGSLFLLDDWRGNPVVDVGVLNERCGSILYSQGMTSEEGDSVVALALEHGFVAAVHLAAVDFTDDGHCPVIMQWHDVGASFERSAERDSLEMLIPANLIMTRSREQLWLMFSLPPQLQEASNVGSTVVSAAATLIEAAVLMEHISGAYGFPGVVWVRSKGRIYEVWAEGGAFYCSLKDRGMLSPVSAPLPIKAPASVLVDFVQGFIQSA